ncbi:duf1446 domain containing protein [Fusarium acutatum]|uniref:Duf1446 domain containing protein n=1 Tax=Fusarium acutatum TaxID=78861 RepID=A0A8H4JD49_9HYPO|nr:duf1446 domain containing protein [Fusarium acutatum]
MTSSVRIANCSGCTGKPYPNLVTGSLLLLVTGIQMRALRLFAGSLEKVELTLSPRITFAEANIGADIPDTTKGIDRGFLKAFDKETAQIVAEKGINIIHNGGGLNPQGLARAIEELLASYGIDSLKVAYVEGDDVIGMTDKLKESGELVHLDNPDITFAAVQPDILCANAYLGMGGIVAALELGADIVMSGRCCDASTVTGAATWWHGWKSSNLNELAGSLIAGHYIECGCYATGGNFSGFKNISDDQNQGFPIAEIEADGTFHIFLQDQAKGLVSRDTITAQLVYEIQGPFYLNPDVIADITNVTITDSGANRVTVTGTQGLLPPPTIKLAVCSIGGYQCETSVYAVGHDIKEKLAALVEAFDQNLSDKSTYQTFRISQYGLEPKSYVAYLPFLIKYDRLPPPMTAPFTGQKFKDTEQPYDLDMYGPTEKVCLGSRVHARSGDKGSNANVGFWVQQNDEYEWLRSFMSVETFKGLLRDEYDPRFVIERFELPNIQCVHFRIKGILDGGVSSTPRLDGLAKSVGEFLRKFP